MDTVTVYTLADPRTAAVKYIGVTKRTPQQRLSEHISNAKGGRLGYRNNWIRSLLRDGLTPVICGIDKVSEENWQERERAWIALYTECGNRLVNSCEGGKGLLNPSAETRRRLSEIKSGKPRSAEVRRAMSERMKGKPISIEMRLKGIESRKGNKYRAGKPHSAETRAKMREAAKKRPPISEDTRRSLREAQGRKAPMSADARRRISVSALGSTKCVGRVLSVKTRLKISEARRAYIARKRLKSQAEGIRVLELPAWAKLVPIN